VNRFACPTAARAETSAGATRATGARRARWAPAAAAGRGLSLAAAALLLAACEPGAAPQGSPGSPGGEAAALETEDQKTSYALGYQLGRNLQPLDLSDPELRAVQQGITDAASEAEPRVDIERYRGEIEQLAADRATAAAEERRAEEQEFREEARAAEGAEVLDSGVILIHEQVGEGPSPDLDDRVTVHYHGTFPDGEVFDSSRERDEPATFPLAGIIPCWTEALQEMKQGGRARVVCPPDTAYGERGAPPRIPPGATLNFEVELLDVHEASGSPQAPPQPGGGASPEPGS